jgi:hypothetical protein
VCCCFSHIHGMFCKSVLHDPSETRTYSTWLHVAIMYELHTGVCSSGGCSYSCWQATYTAGSNVGLQDGC